MSTSIKFVVFGGVAASLLCGAAFAEPKAPTVWQPPAEISGKPAAPETGAPAPPPSAPAASTTEAPAGEKKAATAAKEATCAAEAKTKGLKKSKKWAFIEECMKK